MQEPLKQPSQPQKLISTKRSSTRLPSQFDRLSSKSASREAFEWPLLLLFEYLKINLESKLFCPVESLSKSELETEAEVGPKLGRL